MEEEVEGEAASEEDAGEDEESEAEGEGYSEDELESEGEDDVITGAEGGEAGQEARKQGHAEGGRSGVGGTEVVCITGDRAMQNVLLQMGLGLRAPSGQRVTSMRTFVLRCTACTRISHVRRPCPLASPCLTCSMSCRADLWRPSSQRAGPAS